MLHLNTFGKTPAAEHLVRQLNELAAPKLNRSVGIAVKTFNENIQAVIESVDQDAMTAKVAANLLRLLRLEAQNVNIQCYDESGCSTEYITNLTRNVVIGNIKRAIRQVTVVRKIQNSSVTFEKASSRGKTASGLGCKVTVEIMGYRAGYVSTNDKWIPYYPLSWEILDLVTPEVLHERSQQRRARRAKRRA